MNEIHPTAIVGPDVRLGDNNTVGPFAVLDGEIVIGNGNSIGPHAVVFVTTSSAEPTSDRAMSSRSSYRSGDGPRPWVTTAS